MLVTKITQRVDIPHEEGEWMELRKLSWKDLEQAAEVASDALLDRMKKIGGDIISAFRNTEVQQEQNPTAKYDRAVVLRKGIIKWSYDAEVIPGNIDLLDEETAEWAFQEILGLNKPRTEEEVKNA